MQTGTWTFPMLDASSTHSRAQEDMQLANLERPWTAPSGPYSRHCRRSTMGDCTLVDSDDIARHEPYATFLRTQS
eukprot:6466677-Amphidinium_carterae.1